MINLLAVLLGIAGGKGHRTETTCQELFVVHL